MRAPSPTIVSGALEWARLLRSHSISQARSLLRAGNHHGLTANQLELSLDWLEHLGLVRPSGQQDDGECIFLGHEGRWILAQLLEVESPRWLLGAEELMPTADELPLDFLDIGAALGIPEDECLHLVHAAAGKVDAEARAALGALGESLLVSYLSAHDGLVVEHVSQVSDSYGFDVLVRSPRAEFHLEVKTARTHPSVRMFLSRHEAEVMLRDDAWRLVIVGIGPDDSLASLATAENDEVRASLPIDRSLRARWESLRLTVAHSSLQPGIPDIGVKAPCLPIGPGAGLTHNAYR